MNQTKVMPKKNEAGEIVTKIAKDLGVQLVLSVVSIILNRVRR